MGRFGIMLLFVFLTSKSPAQAPNSSAEQLVRKVVTNELRAENQDHSHWMFCLYTEKPNTPEEVDEVVETKNGDLKYPILISGRKLTEAERGQADQRILQEMQNPSILGKSLHDKTQDNARGQNILKLLPDTFLFQYGERKRNLVELKFRPNPQFQPPTHEAKVFHAMEGTIWVHEKQLRLAQITGHLMHEVKFGGGLLGHLDKGGHFEVKQDEVAPGYWELTAVNVEMNGKALFFKTISVRQKYTRSEFKQVPDNLDLAKAAEILRNQIATRQASMR